MEGLATLNLIHLNLGYCDLQPPAMGILLQTLKTQNLQFLSLAGNSLASHSELLATFLGRAKALRFLNLAKTKLNWNTLLDLPPLVVDLDLSENNPSADDMAVLLNHLAKSQISTVNINFLPIFFFCF